MKEITGKTLEEIQPQIDALTIAELKELILADPLLVRMIGHDFEVEQFEFIKTKVAIYLTAKDVIMKLIPKEKDGKK